MPTPHKHAEIIKAWAEGAQIQVLIDTYPPSGEVEQTWKDFGKDIAPIWVPSYQYRIKPEPQVIECWIHLCSMELNSYQKTKAHKRCTITIHPDE